VAQARREAEQALALDSSLGEAYSVLGNVSAIRRNWLEADAHFRMFSPKDRSSPSYLYALYLSASSGHVRRAVATVQKEYENAPALPVVQAVLGAAQIGLPLRANATADAL